MRSPLRHGASFVLLAAVAAAAASVRDDEEDDSLPVRDGKAIYAERCESCHGATGDGRGPLTVTLGTPARDFAEGGFAFGNTVDAMVRTVSSGIPGRSPMPGFRDVLSEAERRKVVEYVRDAFLPKEEIAEPSATILRVTGRPVIARGPLPPVAEGLPMRPRGLLVGLVEGLTFEYRIDDVRLLAVRQGDFADRRDWNGRGGDMLKPLGPPVYLFSGGDPAPPFSLVAGNGGAPAALSARLDASAVRPSLASIEYSLRAEGLNGRDVARVVEFVEAEALSVGSAFTRHLRLSAVSGPVRVSVALSGGPEAAARVKAPAGAIERAEWVVSEVPDAGFECVRLSSTPAIALAPARSGPVRVVCDLKPGMQAKIAATIVLVPAAVTDEILESLSMEIDR